MIDQLFRPPLSFGQISFSRLVVDCENLIKTKKGIKLSPVLFGLPVGVVVSTWRSLPLYSFSRKGEFNPSDRKAKTEPGLFCVKAQDRSIISLEYDCRITRPFVSQETVVFVVGSWGVWMDSHAFHSHFL